MTYNPKHHRIDDSNTEIEVFLMRIKQLFLYGLIVLFSCWFLGFFVFGFYAYSLQYLPTPQADAIIVLTGGADRIRTGIDLLKRHKAPLLFITGVNNYVSPQELLKTQAALTKEAIYLDYYADNTYQNAQATKDWTQAQNIDSFLLVTSFYHMPRSLFEFSKQMPNAKIYPVPVFIQSSVHWTRTRSAWLVFVEYNKFIIRYIQFQIRRILL